MMTNCTLTEIPTALLVTADAASTGLARDVGPAMYLSFVTRQKANSTKIFLRPSFRADKRARIIIEGYLAAFRVSVGRICI